MFHVCAILIQPSNINILREKDCLLPQKKLHTTSDTTFQTISYQFEITNNLSLPLKDNLAETARIH